MLVQRPNALRILEEVQVSVTHRGPQCPLGYRCTSGFLAISISEHMHIGIWWDKRQMRDKLFTRVLDSKKESRNCIPSSRCAACEVRSP